MRCKDFLWLLFPRYLISRLLIFSSVFSYRKNKNKKPKWNHGLCPYIYENLVSCIVVFSLGAATSPRSSREMQQWRIPRRPTKPQPHYLNHIARSSLEMQQWRFHSDQLNLSNITWHSPVTCTHCGKEPHAGFHNAFRLAGELQFLNNHNTRHLPEWSNSFKSEGDQSWSLQGPHCLEVKWQLFWGRLTFTRVHVTTHLSSLTALLHSLPQT